MPQSKEVHKEYMRKYRQGSQDSKEGSQTYPAIVEALVDPIKRERLEKISQELSHRKLLREVRYGVRGPTFEVVSEMLRIT